MHEQSILDELMGRLELSGCRVVALSLVCTPEALAQRLGRDIACGLRQPDIVQRSTQRLALYPALNTLQIDTTGLTPAQTAQRIAAL